MKFTRHCESLVETQVVEITGEAISRLMMRLLRRAKALLAMTKKTC